MKKMSPLEVQTDDWQLFMAAADEITLIFHFEVAEL